MTRNKWQEYEHKKAILQAMNLTPDEYERRLRELAKRLGV